MFDDDVKVDPWLCAIIIILRQRVTISRQTIDQCSSKGNRFFLSECVYRQGFLRQHPVDLLFVDINMPDITGLDLVRSLEVKPMIIFTTAYRKFAADSYDLDAIDYVLKPVEVERFSRAVNKAAEYYRYRNGSDKKESDVLFVRSELPIGDSYMSQVQEWIKK